MRARAAGPSPPPCRAHENARNLACCRRTTHPGHEQSSHPPGQQTVPGSVSREPEQVVLVIKDRARLPDTGQSESRGITERLAYLSAATHVARAAAVALPSIATPSRGALRTAGRLGGHLCGPPPAPTRGPTARRHPPRYCKPARTRHTTIRVRVEKQIVIMPGTGHSPALA